MPTIYSCWRRQKVTGEEKRGRGLHCYTQNHQILMLGIQEEHPQRAQSFPFLVLSETKETSQISDGLLSWTEKLAEGRVAVRVVAWIGLVSTSASSSLVESFQTQGTKDFWVPKVPSEPFGRGHPKQHLTKITRVSAGSM